MQGRLSHIIASVARGDKIITGTTHSDEAIWIKITEAHLSMDSPCRTQDCYQHHHSCRSRCPRRRRRACRSSSVKVSNLSKRKQAEREEQAAENADAKRARGREAVAAQPLGRGCTAARSWPTQQRNAAGSWTTRAVCAAVSPTTADI